MIYHAQTPILYHIYMFRCLTFFQKILVSSLSYIVVYFLFETLLSEFYEMYQQEQLEKIEKKVQELKRKQEKKMLMVMKHSKIKMLFQMLWKFFQKGKEEYKE